MSPSLLVLVAAALSMAPILLRRPVWAVGFFAFALMLHANLVLSIRFGIDLADPLLFGAMLGLAACYPLLHGDRAAGTGRMFAVCGAWLAAVLVSLVWSTAAGASLGPVRAALPNLLYAMVLFLLITDRARLHAALTGVVAACLLLALLTVVQMSAGLQSFDFYGLANGSVGHIAGDVDALRPTGPVFDPNYYCQILIPGFGIALGAAAGAGSLRSKVGLFLVAVIIGIAILLTASRGGLLAAGIVAVFILIAFRRVRYLMLLVPPVLLTLWFLPAYSERLVSLATSVATVATGGQAAESSVAGRLAEMEAAAILFAEHPLTGIGYGLFESRYQDISANFDLELRGSDRSAHSLYLETAAEQGVIGLAVLLFILGSAMYAVSMALQAARACGDVPLFHALIALGAGGSGLFASSIFLHDAYAQHFWLMIAVLLASERVIASQFHSPRSRASLNAAQDFQ